MGILAIAGLVLIGALSVERKWAPVRKLRGVIELARLEKTAMNQFRSQGGIPSFAGGWLRTLEAGLTATRM